MPATQKRTIPVEIIAEIFSHVDDEDTATLSACAQTSSWFRPRVQQRIFSSVHLDYFVISVEDEESVQRSTLLDIDDNDLAPRFLSLIRNNPRLATYVRDFAFYVHTPGPEISLSRDATLETSSIFQILPLLSNLQAFSFSKRQNDDPCIKSFNCYPESLQALVNDVILRSPGLTYIDIRAVKDFHWNILGYLPHLTSLTFASLCDVGDTDGFAPTSYTIAPTHVVIDDNYQDYETPKSTLFKLLQEGGASEVPPLNLSKLKSLYIHRVWMDEQDVAKLLSFVNPDELLYLRFEGSASTMRVTGSDDENLNESNTNLDLRALHKLEDLILVGVVETDPDDSALGGFVTKTHCQWLGSIINTLHEVDNSAEPQLNIEIQLLIPELLQPPAYLAPSYSNQSNQSVQSSYSSVPNLNMNMNMNMTGQGPASATSTIATGNLTTLGGDANSPELFKDNVRALREEVIKLQALAQDVLSGIQYAFEPNHTPLLTEGNTQKLKEDLARLIERLRQTGVGALPVVSPGSAGIGGSTTAPSESELMVYATMRLKMLYEKLDKSQESAGVVAKLLSP
ncbi:hypothetical protein CVT24_001817 [Panaeolus cyanescens]|uniref:F-box domain-containing protein n=1 Tax=Panaeolus cyanescens TaxID=181874 RepID=A0A409YFI8_9AGAR|nr:hypothetical protein CVT24_001817 [Panaeolus cyanescens]